MHMLTGLEGCKIARVQNPEDLKEMVESGLEGCKIAGFQNNTIWQVNDKRVWRVVKSQRYKIVP